MVGGLGEVVEDAHAAARVSDGPADGAAEGGFVEGARAGERREESAGGEAFEGEQVDILV